MRIGLMTDVYRSGFSGVANHVILLNQSLQELGHEVFVFAFENYGRLAPLKNIYFSPGITLAANYPFGLRLAPQAAQMIQTMDILHVHQPFASGRIAVQQHRKNNIPLVFTSHTRYDLFSKSYLPWAPSNLSLFTIRQYLQYFSRHLQSIIAPGPEMAAMLTSWQIKTPIEVIPNGIDVHAFSDPGVDPHIIRAKYKIPENEFIFLYAGRIATEKNLLFLIQAFGEFLKKSGRAVLLLAGGGPTQQETREFIQANHLEKQIIMTGPVEYLDMPGVMHVVNVFVTASKSEVHPLTLIEAAAAGLPAIGLDAPGVRNIIRHQETGILCPDNIDSYAQTMLFLTHNQTEVNRMGKNAVATAQDYSYRTTARRIFALYQTALS